MRRRSIAGSLTALTLALLLSSCAPSASGTNVASAYDLHAADIRVAPGGSVYVQTGYTFDDLGVDPSKLSGNLWFPAGVNGRSAILTARFALQDVQVPAGWSLELAQVTGTQRTVRGARSFDKSTTDSTLEVVFRAAPPATAVAGPYWLRATLAQGKNTQPVTVALRVVR